ncbi:MAG: DUF11 domain-containing protein, partial [Ruminococcaceae bacterium]|nr:DUF11 domain-containing protein [Oscillospiraceae bacterium]
KLVTDGWANKYTKNTTTTTTTTTTTVTTGMNFDNVNSIAGDKLCLLVFDDMNQTGADSEGRVIIGGDLTVNSGWAVSNTTDFGSDYALIVGGNYSGGANVVGGASAIGEEWIREYAEEAETAFNLVSQKYAELPAEGTSARNQWYRPSVELSANPNHVAGTPHVFYIDGTETIGEVKFKGNFGTDQIIINISGTELTYNGGQWGMFENCDLNATTLAQQTTWNFYEVTSLNTSSLSFYGSVLAPKATYTASNGHVNGTTIVKNMIGTGGFEYHANNFYYDATGIGEQVTTITNTTTSTETTVTSEQIPLSDYEISANGAVTDAAQALESPEITVHIRVKPDLSDLTARKESTPEAGTLVKNGDEITYTINVFNPRTIPAENVVITDAVPAGTTFVSADNGGTLDANGKVVWTATIAPKQSAAVSFTVKVNDSVIGKNNLANVAYAAYATPGVEGTTTINTNTVNHAILSAEKSSSVPAGTILDQGAQITYTINVTNNGSADAANVVVEDTVPMGTTFVSGEGFTDNGNGKLAATIPVLSAGTSQAVSFTVQVNEFATGTVEITNTAYVNGEHTNTTENTAKRGEVIVYHKDKANNADLVEPTASNGKTGDAYGPFTKAEIPNYRYVDVEGSPSGTFTGGTTEVTFYYDRIPGAATIYYRTTDGEQIAEPKSVSGWQGDTLTDNAKVDTIGNWLYESTDDSQGYVFTENGIVIIHYYKLKVDETLPTVLKTAEPANGALVRSGDQITYTISVTNNKYEDMYNVVVTDNAPKGTTIVAVDGAPYAGAAASWTIPVIAAGATASVSFTVQVNGSFDGEGNLANTANVQYVEREASTPTSIDTNTTTHAVLVADKYTSTISNGFVGVGDTYTYFIRVQNVGTAAANGIVIRDDVPAGTSLAAGSTNSWVIDLAPGATKTVSFDVVVNNIDSFNANIINTAYVNDVPTNTTSTPVQKGTVDVHFVDEAGNALADSLHYEGTPGKEHGSVAAALIPAYTYFSTTGETTGTFVNGNITIVHVYKRTPAVATIMYVDKDTNGELLPRVTENAFVGDTLADEHYSDVTNYEFLETTREDGVVFTEDGITIIHYYRFIKPDDTQPTFTKTSDPASGTIVRECSNITYTLTFKNTRIDPVYNLTITDRIPEGSTLVSEDVAADENGVLTWTAAELASGATASVSFTVRVNNDLTGSGNLYNVARAAFENRDNEPEEPIYSNEVSHPVIKAELDHYNNQPDLILTQGDEITYVITTVNTGSATAYDVPVESYIPQGTVFARTEDGEVKNGVFTTVIPELIPGTPVQHTFTVTIAQFAENEFDRDIPNIAKVNEVNTNTVNDNAKIGDLRVNHIDYDGSVIETSFSRERVGTDYGPFTDLVSENKLANRKYISVDNNTTGKYAAQLTTINFYYDRVPATLVVKYVDKDTEQEIKTANIYTDAYFLGDAIPAEHTDEVAIDGYIYHKELLVKPEPMSFDETTEVIVHYYERILDTDRPEVEKTASPASGTLVIDGQEITYSIRVKNVRATDALESVVVTDRVPTGMTLVAGTISGGGKAVEDIITWNVGSIAAGEEKVLTFRAHVDEGLTSGVNLGNIAQVAYRDVQVGKNVTVNTNTTSHALLVFGKQSSVPADAVLTDGSLIKYTVSVRNIGSAAAEGVVITDNVPAGTALIAESLPAGAVVENGVITYAIDKLEAGAADSLTFQVKVSMHDNYSLEIKNVAKVNGQSTNEVVNTAQRGTVTIKYVKVDETGAQTELTEFAGKLEGEVGTAITLPEMETFEKWQHFNTTATSDSETFIAGNIEIVYYFNRIPAKATVYYRDIDVPAATIAPTKHFDAYVGDILPETYQEVIQYYNYVRTDAPTTLEYTEDGLVITHWYDEIIDKTDLLRSKTSVPAPGTVVLPGSDITYTITVKNPRREALSNITVIDPIPAGCTVKAADGADVADGNVVWNNITLDVNEEKSFSFTVQVDEAFNQEGNLANKAAVVFTNRKDTEPTTLYTEKVTHAVLVTNKTVDKAETNVGGEITYTISAANYGTAAAQNVVITDTVPAGTVLKADSAVGATVKDDVITWNIGKLDAGKSVEVKFTVIAAPIANDIYNIVVSNTAMVCDVPTNTVTTTVRQGTVTVTHVTDTGAILIPAVVTTYDVGDSYEYSKEEIYGYDYLTVEGQPKGKTIEGNIDITFVYEKGEGVLTVCYLEEGTNTALADSESEILNIGDVITDLHEKSISGYTLTSTEKPEELVMVEEGVEIIHYYTYSPDKFKVAGAAWVADDSDSTFSDGDAGYEDLTVKLVDGDGNIVDITTTDSEGKFEFNDVPTGNYTVDFELPEKYKLAGAVEYANEQLNSVVDETGKFAISVIENTDNIGMELFRSEVLGASEEVINTFQENTVAYRNNIQTVQPIKPVITKAENAGYSTTVLGDMDGSPNTGDNEMATVAAVMIASCALFVLILCRKSK